MNLALVSFYILLLFLPSQLGRHFFPNFSLVSGVISDYLIPVFYFTDFLIILTIFLYILENWHNWLRPKYSSWAILILTVLIYLFFNSTVIASNKWVAVYKMVKIAEFILLGHVVYRLKPKLLSVLSVLSICTVYSSVLSVWQFVSQKSVGGLFYWLGERTFSSNTPGIAVFSLNGQLILRSYATFPHPNVLGGFLAILLPAFLFLLINRKKMKIEMRGYYWFLFALTLGIVSLVLTFSRAAWIITLLGFFLVVMQKKKVDLLNILKNKNLVLFLFYTLMFLSVFTLLVFPQGEKIIGGKSWSQRAVLDKTALVLTLQHPLLGIGLNNFVVQAHSVINNYSDIYLLQPVHNFYLLILVETGLIGFAIFLLFIDLVLDWSIKSGLIVLIIELLLFSLGFFDHYLFTLQQGQLFFTIFTSLALIPRKI
ncbi:O-antigen ligase family protein [Patescibacteria group bacterium]|nr:O-antigen ligase family protein [Patescibacteria group bacterium]